MGRQWVHGLKRLLARYRRSVAAPSVARSRPGARRILVSSNCQTGGLAAALQVIFPNDVIIPAPLAESEGALRRLAADLSCADAWVSNGRYELIAEGGLGERVQLVRIPRIRFSGFHPDLIYSRRRATGELVHPHYNSAIAVWAYSRQIGVHEASKLYTGRVYEELGYLDAWNPSVAGLKGLFQGTDIAFADFFLGVQREGLFMHSINHPKVDVIARLAKLAALHLGRDRSVLDKPINIHDGLNEIIWPLYPEIGDVLALPGNLDWKLGEGDWAIGVETYLERAYAAYKRAGITGNDIMPVQVDESLYDRVLAPRVRRVAHV